MDLIQIDIIHLQALERLINGIQNMFAREAFIIDVVAHLSVNFGGNDHILSPDTQFFKKISGDALTLTGRVYICSIKKVDPHLEGALDKWFCLVLFQHPWAPLP